MDNGDTVTLSSNLDIRLSRSNDTKVFVADKDWGSVSDHRPIRFSVKAKLRLKDLRRQIAKSLFCVPAAI